MKKILSAILAVMLLVGAIVIPSSAALPVIVDKESGAVDYKATVEQYLSDKNVFTTDEAKLAKMTLSYEKDGYQLWVDELTGEVATVDVSTGRTLFTNPIDIGSTNAAYSNTTKYELMSQIIVKYIDNGDPKTFTSFEQAAMNGQIDIVNIRNGLRVEYTIGREDTKYLVPRLIERQRFITKILQPMVDNIVLEHGITIENILGAEATRDGFFTGKNLAYNTNADTDFGKYSRFAQFYTLQDPNNEKLSTRELAEMQNNFPITKETYNGQLMAVCVCPDSTAANDLFFLESLIKTYCPLYTFEDLEVDHEITKYTVTERPPALFKMALEYRLDDLGLTVRLPANGIRFNEAEYQLENIAILPWMGAGSNENTGYTFFPDGSGAIFRFEDLNDGKNHTVNGSIYGSDYAYHNATEIKHQEVIRYPVFGIVEDVPMNELLIEEGSNDTKVSEGFVAILEEGDALAKVELKHYGGVSKYNSIYVLVNPRPKDQYVLSDAVSVGSNSSVTVLSKRKYVDDYKIRYVMLTDPKVAAACNVTEFYDASWVGMATAYRDYLASPYSTGTQNLPEDQQTSILSRLTENDINQSGVPLYIETFGAVETIQKVLSIPVKQKVALTSFDNIQTMYDQLSAAGITNINFKLNGYYNGGMQASVPYKFDVEKSVGGKDGLTDLINDAKANGYGVFVDFDFVYADAMQTKMFDGLKNNRDLVKSIDDRYISKSYYSVTRQSYTSYFELAISASRFEYFYDKVSAEYLSYNPVGISLSTLASNLNSDFDEDEPYNREDSKDFTMALFDKISNDYSSVMADSANSYTWGYLDHIINTAVDSSRYTLASNSVPFMGMVLHGYVQFAGTPTNMEGNIDYAMLKAIENGAGLYFILSYDNTEILKEDAELSQYYSVIYEIWFEELVEKYTTVNGLLSDLQLNLIIDHEFLIGERNPDPDEIEADAKLEQEMKDQAEIDAAAALELSVIKAINATRFSLVDTMNAHKSMINDQIAKYGDIYTPGTQLYTTNDAFRAVTIAEIVAISDARAIMLEADAAYKAAFKAHGLRPTAAQKEEQAALYAVYDEAYKAYQAVFNIASINKLVASNKVASEYILSFDRYMKQADEYLAVAQIAYNAMFENAYPEIINPDDYSDTIKNQIKDNYDTVKAIRDSICGAEGVTGELQKLVDEYIAKYYYVAQVVDPSIITLDTIIYGEPEADDTNDDYVYTKYTNDNGNIVAVTYGGKNGNDAEAKVTFILNYNFFDVTVYYDGVEYVIEGFGYVKIDH